MVHTVDGLKQAAEVHGPGGRPGERPKPGAGGQGERLQRPIFGPELISLADEGNVRLADRRTVRNKA